MSRPISWLTLVFNIFLAGVPLAALTFAGYADAASLV
jgi:hypothetical protein